MLRFPEGMRERFRQEAVRNGRSMNAEIILRLEKSLLEGEVPTPSPSPAVLKDEIKQDILDELVGLIREAIEDAVAESRPEKEE